MIHNNTNFKNLNLSTNQVDSSCIDSSEIAIHSKSQTILCEYYVIYKRISHK